MAVEILYSLEHRVSSPLHMTGVVKTEPSEISMPICHNCSGLLERRDGLLGRLSGKVGDPFFH